MPSRALSREALMPDRKVMLLLKMMDSANGSIDATDNDHSLLNYFCDDRKGNIDTFNRAIDAGLIRTTFHDMFETSEAFLTDAGRAALQQSPQESTNAG